MIRGPRRAEVHAVCWTKPSSGETRYRYFSRYNDAARFAGKLIGRGLEDVHVWRTAATWVRVG